MDGAARTRRRARRAEREERHDSHGDLPHRGLQGHRPGHDRLRGHEAHPADAARPAPTIVGGVNPRKAGQHGRLRGRRDRARCSARSPRRWRRPAPTSRSIFVPPEFTKAAVDRGDRRRHPARRRHHRGRPGARHRRVLRTTPASKGTTRIIGPNCPGLISPGQSNAGIIPADITGAGPDRPGLASPAR